MRWPSHPNIRVAVPCSRVPNVGAIGPGMTPFHPSSLKDHPTEPFFDPPQHREATYCAVRTFVAEIQFPKLSSCWTRPMRKACALPKKRSRNSKRVCNGMRRCPNTMSEFYHCFVEMVDYFFGVTLVHYGRVEVVVFPPKNATSTRTDM